MVDVNPTERPRLRFDLSRYSSLNNANEAVASSYPGAFSAVSLQPTLCAGNKWFGSLRLLVEISGLELTFSWNSYLIASKIVALACTRKEGVLKADVFTRE